MSVFDNYKREFITGDAMLIIGGFIHCAGTFIGFQTNVVQTWS
jgi:hypothetical protein